MPELVLERLLRLRDRDPPRPAVDLLRPRAGGFVAESLSLGAWLDEAAACAGGLADRGVCPGDRVLLCVPTSRGFLQALVGCLWRGAVAVPLPSLEGHARTEPFRARLLSVLRHAEPALVVADRRTADFLRRTGLVRAGASLATPEELAAGPRAPLRLATPSEVALLQYTSGSTGAPRGVHLTHANVAANVGALGAALHLSGDDRQVTWLPLYHDMGLIGGLLTTALHGVHTSLLSPLDFLGRPSLWLHAVSAGRATLTVAPNFAYSLLARKVPEEQLAGLDLSTLRAAVNGAEPVDVETARRFTRRFAPYGFHEQAYLPVYGMAEATLSVTVPPPGRPLRVDRVRRRSLADERTAVPAADGDGVGFVSVGPPIPGHRVSIVDPVTGAALPERHLGEIVVQGPSVSPGYHGEAPRQQPDTVHTGDLGYLAEGELYVIDRLKDLVIIAGRSHSPSDIERAAEAVAGARLGRSAAFGVARPERGTESLVVVIEGRGDPARLQRQVERAVVEQVGLAPDDVVVVSPSTLARTSSGKIMRRDARDRYLVGRLTRSSRFSVRRGLQEALHRLRLRLQLQLRPHGP